MLSAEDRNKIKYLEQYLFLKRSIERKIREKAEIQSIAEKMTSSIGEVPSGTPDPHVRETAMAALVDLKRDIEADISQMVLMKDLVMASIGSVLNPRFREVLEARYINGMTFEEILVHLDKRSWSHLHRIHEKALKGITIQFDNF